MSIVSMGVCPKCGKGANTACFAEYEDGCKCFSCGFYSLRNNYPFIMKEISGHNEALKLPVYTQKLGSFNLQALEFFNRYFIDEKLLKKYRVGYCAENNSVLYPLLPNYTQERFLGKKGFKTYGSKPFFITHSLNKRTIILVEDFLSCIRVGEICTTICLFGTHCPNNVIDYLISSSSDILVWLDGDEPGQKASRRIIENLNRRQRKYPFLNMLRDIVNIKTNKDPKSYTDQEIKGIICI